MHIIYLQGAYSQLGTPSVLVRTKLIIPSTVSTSTATTTTVTTKEKTNPYKEYLLSDESEDDLDIPVLVNDTSRDFEQNAGLLFHIFSVVMQTCHVYKLLFKRLRHQNYIACSFN